MGKPKKIKTSQQQWGLQTGKSLPDLQIQTRKLQKLRQAVLSVLVSWRELFCARFARGNKLSWIRGVTLSSAPVSFYSRISFQQVLGLCLLERKQQLLLSQDFLTQGPRGGRGGGSTGGLTLLSLPPVHTLLSVRGTRGEHPRSSSVFHLSDY